MTSAEIYLEAARLIESGEREFSCNAVEKAAGVPFAFEFQAYEAMFAPVNLIGDGDTWISNPCHISGYGIPKRQQRAIRFTMLALAAAVAEAGDLGDFL